MSKRSDVLRIYRYFLKKMGERYRPQPRDREIITTFLLELHLLYNLRTIGKRFFYRYITNQFEYRLTSRSFSKFSIPNVFGKKALKRYSEDKKRVEMSFIDRNFARDYDIRFSEIFPNIEKITLDSQDKKRFHNTPAGLLFCMDTTTMYDRSDYLCITCIHSTRCKEIKMSRDVRESSI